MMPRVYLKLPNPTLLKVLLINPNMEFIGILQKKVGFGRLRYRVYCLGCRSWSWLSEGFWFLRVSEFISPQKCTLLVL